MKKIIRIAAMIVAVAAMTCILFACGDGAKTDNGTNSDIEKLKGQIESLEAGQETMKNQIADLEEELAGKNVFWTEKAAYTENETMTVYYGKNAVFSLAFDFSGIAGHISNSGSTINSDLIITSLMANLYASSILQTAYIQWDKGIFNAGTLSSTTLCEKNIPTSCGAYFDDTSEALENATYFDYVICVPGTPFPLARFKNVTVNIRGF